MQEFEAALEGRALKKLDLVEQNDTNNSKSSLSKFNSNS